MPSVQQQSKEMTPGRDNARSGPITHRPLCKMWTSTESSSPSLRSSLGVEAHATRPDLYARSMRKPLHEYVENLDEVREALRGTPWAADPVLTA